MVGGSPISQGERGEFKKLLLREKSSFLSIFSARGF